MRKPASSRSDREPRPDATLENVAENAASEDRQLRALCATLNEALALPLDAFVIGEPVALLAVNYDGNTRRGLVARCRRQDGTEHSVSLVDVQLPAASKATSQVAAYRQWVGAEPALPGPSSELTRRRHKVAQEELDMSRPVDLVVLTVKESSARCRLLGSERMITLRATRIWSAAPGEIVTVRPNRQWRYSGHPYLSGTIERVRMEATALGLTPLRLSAMGQWDPQEQYWGEENEPLEDWVRPIIERGLRPMFEMEQVLPGQDPDDFDSDMILEANELKARGDYQGARDILNGLLEADLRCLDAHAHLGSLTFDACPQDALKHYEAGLRIGELSLDADFDGVLPWGCVDNRPFLRCMHGYGLCAWRLGRFEEAQALYARMLWLNPSDNQGIRFLVPEVAARMAWKAES